jgi:hypothetical protein
VRLNGVVVPDGTVIRAIVEGYVYTTTTPTTAYGTSTYAIIIPKPVGMSYDGKSVTFLIGDYLAAESSTWEDGGNKLLNLTASSTP